MSSKFWYLMSVSLKKKVKTKWFLFANIILAVVIIGLININSIISFFGGEFDDTNEIVLLDNTGYTNTLFQNNLEQTNIILANDYKVEYEIFDKSEAELNKYLENTNKVAIIFNSDNNHYIKAKIVSNEKIDSLFYQMLVQSLTLTKNQIAINLTSIDLEELEKINSPIEIERVILDSDAKSEDESMAMIMGTVFPTVILPFFMLVVFLVSMLGSEINEEKSTRSMEVIISNVSPKTHFFSKIVAANLFVLTQGALLIIYSLIGLFISNTLNVSASSNITDNIGQIWNTLAISGILDKLYYIIPLTLVLMILSFLAYSLVAGILASMTVNVEDFQQIQTPIMLISLLAYYLAIMAGMFEGSILIKILSYVPFISCLLSPALLVIGQITIIDVIIAIILLVIFNFITIKYGLKIYKIGILNYSADKMWSRLFKAARSK